MSSADKEKKSAMAAFGCDMKKWFITRTNSPDGRWHVCPPAANNDLEWYRRGGSFTTGAEALAAFAEGKKCYQNSSIAGLLPIPEDDSEEGECANER